MDINTLRKIIDDSDISDDSLFVLLERAKKIAKNHYFWHPEDVPTAEQLEAFYDRYEYEIYDIAKEIHDVGAREGLKQFTELGVTRVWNYGGMDSVMSVVNALIIPKTYAM